MRYAWLLLICLSGLLACDGGGGVLAVEPTTLQQAELVGGASVCGNARKENGEACDDGNVQNGDGCSALCVLEPGSNCIVPPNQRTVCEPCGNGLTLFSEQCDDGNVTANDGCSGTCAVEAGWVCLGSPSTCHRPVCGDGVAEGGEGCDAGAQNSDIFPDRCRTNCTLPRCGDGVEDLTEVCDWGPDNGTSNGCLANCAGYADYQFSNGADIALTPIPSDVAILASVTDAELQCIHTDPIDFEAYEARSVAVHSYDMVVGAVVVLAVDTLVDDPVILFDNGEHSDGRTLVHERAPFVDVAPGRYFLPAGSTVATGLHGGSFSPVSCPCSTGGSQSMVGCEILAPGRNPDPCGNPYSSPTEDRIVGSHEFCPAQSALRVDFGFGPGLSGGCRSSCLVEGSLMASCDPEGVVGIDHSVPDGRSDCAVRTPQVDTLCQAVSGGALAGCPGMCEGRATEICGSLVPSDGADLPDWSCGVMTNSIAIAGPESGCFGELPPSIDDVERELAGGQLTLRVSWATCLAYPQAAGCQGRRVPPGASDGPFGTLVDGTEVTLRACEDRPGGMCAICSMEGIGKGCLPVVNFHFGDDTNAAPVAPGSMHGEKLDTEGRQAAYAEFARRMATRIGSRASDAGANPPAVPEPPPTGKTDPVSLASGELLLSAQDFAFPSRGVPLDFTRSYRSGGSRSGAFGPGWTHAYEERIEVIGDPENRRGAPLYCTAALPLIRCLIHHDGQGGSQLYILNPAEGELPIFLPAPGAFGTISVFDRRSGFVEIGATSPAIRLREPNGVLHTFDWMSGVLLSVTDENGFGVTLDYDLLTGIEVEAEGAAYDSMPPDFRRRSHSIAGSSAHRDRMTRLNALKLVGVDLIVRRIST